MESEIARIKAQIELESAAMRSMKSFASVGQHSFITSKMERIGKLHDDLRGMIGDGKAAKFLVHTMDRH